MLLIQKLLKMLKSLVFATVHVPVVQSFHFLPVGRVFHYLRPCFLSFYVQHERPTAQLIIIQTFSQFGYLTSPPPSSFPLSLWRRWRVVLALTVELVNFLRFCICLWCKCIVLYRSRARFSFSLSQLNLSSNAFWSRVLHAFKLNSEKSYAQAFQPSSSVLLSVSVAHVFSWLARRHARSVPFSSCWPFVLMPYSEACHMPSSWIPGNRSNP